MDAKRCNSSVVSSCVPEFNYVKGGVRVDTFAELIYIPILQHTENSTVSGANSADASEDSMFDNLLDDLRTNKPLLYKEMFGS